MAMCGSCPCSGGDADVVLREVAGVTGECRALCKLGADGGEVVGELVELRPQLARVRRLIQSSQATITWA